MKLPAYGHALLKARRAGVHPAVVHVIYGWDFTLRHVGSEVRLWCDARPDSKPAAAIAPTPAPVNPRAQLKARLDDAWDEDRTPASSSDASGVASRLREAAKLTQPGARTVVRR